MEPENLTKIMKKSEDIVFWERKKKKKIRIIVDIIIAIFINSNETCF